MREAAIQIEQVSKSFQGREVLKNISCELNWGAGIWNRRK